MQAVTSSGSAEQIAVSSLMTYDLYQTYINPKATPRQLILVCALCLPERCLQSSLQDDPVLPPGARMPASVTKTIDFISTCSCTVAQMIYLHEKQ